MSPLATLPDGWIPPSAPGETFHCYSLRCSGVKAHVCCLRQVLRRRHKSHTEAEEAKFPYCVPECPQGSRVRAAMPSGYEPRAFQRANRRRRARATNRPLKPYSGSLPWRDAHGIPRTYEAWEGWEPITNHRV